MSYNYYEAMKEDVKNYINENIERTDYTNDRDTLEKQLNDGLFTEDSVTGNESGSYTFNRYTAQEYVLDNMDLLNEAAKDFGITEEEIGRRFLDEDFEYFDVMIRCCILGSAISDVLDDMESEGYFDDPE